MPCFLAMPLPVGRTVQCARSHRRDRSTFLSPARNGGLGQQIRGFVCLAVKSSLDNTLVAAVRHSERLFWWPYPGRWVLLDAQSAGLSAIWPQRILHHGLGYCLDDATSGLAASGNMAIWEGSIKPKPSARGMEKVALARSRVLMMSGGSCLRAPVTPITETTWT